MSDLSILDHPDLAERIRARDPEALEVVVETYLPQILRAARGAGLRPQQAEDVAQNTFTTFSVAWTTGSERSPPGGETAPTAERAPMRSSEPSVLTRPARS